MALIMEIMQTIAQPINELALWFEKTYNIDPKETITKWHELTGMVIMVDDGKVNTEEVRSLDIPPPIRKSKKIPKNKEGSLCNHVYKVGVKAGEQCSTKPKNGADYCSAHKAKDSTRSASISSSKQSKRKEVKQVVKIDQEFESSDEDEPQVKPKKEKKVSKKHKDDSLDEDDEPEVVKPLLRKKNSKMVNKALSYDTDDEKLDDDLDLEDF